MLLLQLYLSGTFSLFSRNDSSQYHLRGHDPPVQSPHSGVWQNTLCIQTREPVAEGDTEMTNGNTPQVAPGGLFLQRSTVRSKHAVVVAELQ